MLMKKRRRMGKKKMLSDKSERERERGCLADFDFFKVSEVASSDLTNDSSKRGHNEEEEEDEDEDEDGDEDERSSPFLFPPPALPLPFLLLASPSLLSPQLPCTSLAASI